MLTQAEKQGGADVMQLVKIGLIIIAVVTFFASPAAAQSKKKKSLKKQMNQVGNFLAIVIGFVAIPNGAYGVFQYMTAGTDSEQSEKGRKRIRNSFIGVAGATAVVTAVQFLNALI